MPGLVPGNHVLNLREKEDVDGRVKPGHDGFFPVHTAILSATAPFGITHF
jgi:hypothetical protein